jgi:thioredoxin-like negative regulator of GroEL
MAGGRRADASRQKLGARPRRRLAATLPSLCEGSRPIPATIRRDSIFAILLNARNRREEAAAGLIEIIKRDRVWNDDGARKQLLQFFDAWGAADPATISARRKLSTLLFC